MSEQRPELHVNIAFKYMRPEDFEFLSLQQLHPELYFAGEDVDAITPAQIDQIEEELKNRHFRTTVHSPFYDLNPGAHDPKVRALTLERMIWSLNIAKRFQAMHVVMHGGYGPWVNKKNFPAWLDRARHVLTPLLEKAKDLGLKIAFENIYDDSPEDLALMLEGYPLDLAGVCFDVGHFNIFSECSIVKWLDVLGSRLYEFHLHDNLGSEDLHIAVGDGSVKFGPLVNWLRNRETAPMPVMALEMEQKTHVIKSVSRVRQWFEPQKES